MAAGGVSGALLLWESVETCSTQDGSAKDKSICSRLVVSTLCGVGFSGLAYHRTGNAGG